MSQNLNLDLTISSSNLTQPLNEQAKLIEIDLARNSLQQQLFGRLVSFELAQTVAWQMVSMLQLSLETGNFYQFQRQIEWEIRVALTHHQLHKLETDLRMLDLLENSLLSHLDAQLETQIKTLINQLRQLFWVCWEVAERDSALVATLN